MVTWSDLKNGHFDIQSGQFDPERGQFGLQSGHFDPERGQFGLQSGVIDQNDKNTWTYLWK